MKKSMRAAIGFGVVVAGFALFAACSGGGPGSGSAPSATSSADRGWTRAEVAAAVFAHSAKTTVLGTADGVIVDHGSFPATVEVTEVKAGDASTLVRFTLKNPADTDVSIPLGAFNARQPLTKDIRDIALLEPAQNQRLQPFLALHDPADPSYSSCTCSSSPKQMTKKGQMLSATFPPLDKGTKTVSIELTGFPVIANLPVSRG